MAVKFPKQVRASQVAEATAVIAETDIPDAVLPKRGLK
jgi:hypothetical protein